MWVDQGSEFIKVFFEKRLDDSDMKMCSTYNEGKSVAAEIFIRTLKNKIYKHMTAGSKNVYFDVLDDIVDKYDNTYHRTIKMKPIDIKSGSYVDCNVDSNAKDPKLSQYFPKSYGPFGGDNNIKEDFLNYTTKADLKNATGADTSTFAKKLI